MTDTQVRRSRSSSGRKRGRPRGTFGVKKKQAELVKQYIDALGGEGNITPLQESEITRVIVLKSIAENARSRLVSTGASVEELRILATLEATADAAAAKLGKVGAP